MPVLSWDEYFMHVANLSAMRSKDPNTKVGACIVDNDNHIVSCGYNGSPNGISDSIIPWNNRDCSSPLEDQKYPYVCHAELNAILNATRSCKDTRIYVGLFPCHECAKAIIQSGIKKVIYADDKYDGTESNIVAKKMFKLANIETIKLNLQYELLILPKLN